MKILEKLKEARGRFRDVHGKGLLDNIIFSQGMERLDEVIAVVEGGSIQNGYQLGSMMPVEMQGVTGAKALVIPLPPEVEVTTRHREMVEDIVGAYEGESGGTIKAIEAAALKLATLEREAE